MYEHPHEFRIVCIDPGTDTLGVGVLGLNLYSYETTVHEALTLRASNRIDPYSTDAQFAGLRYARLQAHSQSVYEILCRVNPHAVISEAPFLGRFAQSFEALVECMSMLRRTVAAWNPAIPLETVDPPSAKKAVGAVITGPDKKESVRLAVLRTPLIRGPGVYLESLDEHATDALAVGLYKVKQIKDFYRV